MRFVGSRSSTAARTVHREPPLALVQGTGSSNIELRMAGGSTLQCTVSGASVRAWVVPVAQAGAVRVRAWVAPVAQAGEAFVGARVASAAK